MFSGKMYHKNANYWTLSCREKVKNEISFTQKT